MGELDGSFARPGEQRRQHDVDVPGNPAGPLDTCLVGLHGGRSCGPESRAGADRQRCIPHRYTVRSSTFRKITFSTVIPMRITVNSPAKTCAVSRFWLFS